MNLHHSNPDVVLPLVQAEPDQESGVLDEVSFHRIIALEEKRTKRSRKPFLLMLLDAGSCLSRNKSGNVLSKILSALSLSTRDTDVTGWYKSHSVVGVMFTEISLDRRGSALNAMRSRVSETLRHNLTSDKFNQINISVRVVPEGWDLDMARDKPATRPNSFRTSEGLGRGGTTHEFPSVQYTGIRGVQGVTGGTYTSAVAEPTENLVLAHAAQGKELARPTRPLQSRAVAQKRKVWIDLDNSPHVPLFLPIIEELKQEGVDLTLTARNMYQVCELLEFFKLRCKVIGGHWGKNKFLKVLCNLLRVVQLAPTVLMSRPDLAISHGSRAQVLLCKLLGIPTMMMHDYEHSTKTGFLEPDWVLMPDVIPDGAMSKHTDKVLRYPGLKEDVYIPTFEPNPSILTELGISPNDLVVTLRPPATEAHYHNPESEVLFAETVRLLASTPNVRAVTLPRNARQGHQLREEWSELIASGRMLIPSTAVDGLNLIWFSDLVVSGGGTMNREAAALGVPVYSIFRGTIGAVDQYLVQQGRLTLIENVEDVHSKIKLTRWNRPIKPESRNRPVLQFIVDGILLALASEDKVQVVPSQSLAKSTSSMRAVQPPVRVES